MMHFIPLALCGYGLIPVLAAVGKLPQISYLYIIADKTVIYCTKCRVDRPSFLGFLSGGQKEETGLRNQPEILKKKVYIQILSRSAQYNAYPPVCNFSENVDFRPRGDYGGPIRNKFFKLGC